MWLSFIIALSSYAASPVLRNTLVHPGVTVTKSAGIVGDHVLTSREVRISYAVDQVLGLSNNVNSIKELVVPSSGETYSAIVTNSLLEWIVKFEADSFSVGKISSEEVKKTSYQVGKELEKFSVWKDMDVSSTELDEVVLRKLTARNFIRFKTETSGVAVSDAEAKDYYEKNRVKFGSVPFDQLKDNIRTYLAQQTAQARLREWFETLKRKYKVRSFAAEKRS